VHTGFYAIAALLCMASIGVEVVVVLIGDRGAVILGLAGLTATVSGTSWAISRRERRSTMRCTSSSRTTALRWPHHSMPAAGARQLDSGELGVVAVTAQTGLQAAEVISLALAGHGNVSGHAFEVGAKELEVRSSSTTVSVGIDGETVELDPPLAFRIHAPGLRMLVPEGNLEASLVGEPKGPECTTC
jgi:hypothetical protein